MNRTQACDNTVTYRSTAYDGHMRTLVACLLGRFEHVRLYDINRLTRGRHECALCSYRIAAEREEQ